MSKTITAVIPVRAGSRRLKNKNILTFGNSNLLIRKIRQLKKVKEVDTIVVSSDSREMLDMALKEGVSVQERPVEYCDEISRSFNDVVEYVASHLTGDIVIWAPCVCPYTSDDNFRTAVAAYEQFVERGEFDSVVSCKAFKEYLFDERGPLNFRTEQHVSSQNLPEWKVIVNGFYISSRKNMMKWKYIYGKNPYLITLSKKVALDIDDHDDFLICTSLYTKEDDI